ncbi:hypothetical protein GCM10010412_098770 [Nonomuraea recticatena]|uniref:Biotin and thiamin synthesis-associated domain-containing protein n=1 Tax=Nonomuraea recticatena TaxID=46178 RepID=A0ABP6FV50_9ACTN
MSQTWELTPQRCLRILAMVRFVCPDVEVRLAGGREIHLRSLQPLALHIVNSVFLGDYLTSEGQPGKADQEMIKDLGFAVEELGSARLPEHRGAAAPAQPGKHGDASAAESARTDLVALRRRGAGTDLAPNA